MNSNVVIGTKYHILGFKGTSDIEEEFYNNIKFLNEMPTSILGFENRVSAMEVSIDLIFKNENYINKDGFYTVFNFKNTSCKTTTIFPLLSTTPCGTGLGYLFFPIVLF